MKPEIRLAGSAVTEYIEMMLPFAVIRVKGGGFRFRRKLRKALKSEGASARKTARLELTVEYDAHSIAFGGSESENAPFYAALKRLYGGFEVTAGQDEQLIEMIKGLLKLFEIYLASDRELFELMSVDPVKPSTHNTLILNCINMNPEQMSRFGVKENDYVRMIHPVSFKSAEGIVKQNPKVKPGEMYLTRGLKKALGMQEDSSHNVIVSVPTAAQGFAISPQMVSNIEQNNVVVTQDIFDQLDPNASLFELYNRITRSSLDVPRDRIETEKGNNRIRLSYLYRAFLDVEAPILLEPHFYHSIMQHPELTDDERALLRECYEHDKVAPLKFELKRKLKNIFDKAGYKPVVLKPVSVVNEKWRLSDLAAVPGKLKQLALRWLIGYHTMSLKVIRPCSVDESSNVVRLTSTMLRMIGIENTDNVIVSYRNKEIKARVLEVEADYFDNMKETNAIINNSDFEMCVGIPSHMRSKLGMNGINCVCRVRRDTGYIFMKHVHSQIIPTIGIVFAVQQLSISYTWKLAVVFVALCLSLYVGFANERNKINT